MTSNVNVNKTDDITDEYGGGKFSEAIRANDTLTIENGATVNVTSLAGIELSDGSKLGANPIISYGDVIISGNSNVTAKGISDGENPNAAITRQELVTMLYRLAGEPAVSGTITAPDAASVSTWATSAMTWAMNIGLVEGDENGAVTPTATATRAQAAALIMRYLES